MVEKRTSPLLALTSAALALPAFGATQPTTTEISARTSVYEEESVPASRVALGSLDRYDIDIHQFHVLAPLANDWSLAVDVNREVMSGASPWGTATGADGEPALIMSGATIRESRNGISLAASRYFADKSVTVALSRSDENDYEANAVSVSSEWDFNGKLSTLLFGLSYSSDDIRPSDRLLRDDKRILSVSVGWTQVLNRNAVLQSGISVTKHSGFLGDPYKLLDVRPDERLQWAVSMRYRKYFDSASGALHLDYRYYDDDFGVSSHTIKTAWYQNLGVRFQVIPSVRFYSQREADFYTIADDFTLPATVPRSSDHRLSSFGAYTFGLKGVFRHGGWTVSANVERYISDGDYGFSNADVEHPALVEFQLTSIGVSYTF